MAVSSLVVMTTSSGFDPQSAGANIMTGLVLGENWKPTAMADLFA
jgi:hypothetical protein